MYIDNKEMSEITNRLTIRKTNFSNFPGGGRGVKCYSYATVLLLLSRASKTSLA